MIHQIGRRLKKCSFFLTLLFATNEAIALGLNDFDKATDNQKTNVIMQRLDASCGLAALATVLHYQFGQDVTEESLILELDTLEPDEKRLVEGLTLRDIQQLANNRGLYASWKKVSIDGLGMLSKKGAVIIRFMVNKYTPHFSVLKKNGVEQDLLYLADPSFGNITVKRDELINRWYLSNQKFGYVLILEATEKNNLLDKSTEQNISYLDIDAAQLQSYLFAPNGKWVARLTFEKATMNGINYYYPISGLSLNQGGHLYTAGLQLAYGLSKHSSLEIYGSWSRSTINYSASYTDIYGNSASSSASNSTDKISNFGIGLSHIIYEEESHIPQVSFSGNAILPSSDINYGYGFSVSISKSINEDLLLFSGVSASRYLMTQAAGSNALTSSTNVGYSLGGIVPLLKEWGVLGQLIVQRQLTWLPSPSITKNWFYRGSLIIPITRLISVEPYYSITPNASKAIGLSVATRF